MRNWLIWLLLVSSGWAQPRIQELQSQERDTWLNSLFHQAFADHTEDIVFTHVVRVARVNGTLHGLTMHQAGLHNPAFSWTHWVYQKDRWVERGRGVPDRDDCGPVQLEREEIERHLRQMVRGLALQGWSQEAVRAFLDPAQFVER